MDATGAPLHATRYLGVRFYFFKYPANTYIYTLSLHDALPIWFEPCSFQDVAVDDRTVALEHGRQSEDRKSTRLNSSHVEISYAVFCLKKIKLFLHYTHPSLLLG